MKVYTSVSGVAVHEVTEPLPVRFSIRIDFVRVVKVDEIGAQREGRDHRFDLGSAPFLQLSPIGGGDRDLLHGSERDGPSRGSVGATVEGVGEGIPLRDSGTFEQIPRIARGAYLEAGRSPRAVGALVGIGKANVAEPVSGGGAEVRRARHSIITLWGRRGFVTRVALSVTRHFSQASISREAMFVFDAAEIRLMRAASRCATQRRRVCAPRTLATLVEEQIVG
mmetsp:Transcript_2032/g.4442  ORF Transcript_2032/g.4442 Transcript_2032/m.4442 type:complete len:224 (+) Transcript_2032:542-1213(+)